MRRRGALVLCAGVLLSACGGGRGPSTVTREPEDAIVVAAFNFPESRLLGELYAGALEAAGYPVAGVQQIGSRETVEPALEQGLVDVVPEYTGSALNFLRRRADAADADLDRTYSALEEAFAERDVTVAKAAPAENQNVVVVRRDTAETLGLRTLSDLAAVAGTLVFGGPPECPQRPLCLLGLRDTYGASFFRFLSMDESRDVAAALQAGEVDAGLLFTTDPALSGSDFVVLEDDRGLQPAEHVVPVIRDEVVDRHGAALLDAMDELSAKLTTEALAAANVRVDRGDAVEAVARDLLAELGITR